MGFRPPCGAGGSRDALPTRSTDIPGNEVTVKIYEGEGNSGQLLANQVILFSGRPPSLPTKGYRPGLRSNPVIQNIEFDVLFPVISGETYTCYFRSNDIPAQNWLSANSPLSGDAYPAGESSFPGGDFSFRTYVKPTFDLESTLIVKEGNVGVGASQPQSKLEVAGTIHTTSGGIKFPDGTVQLTSSLGIEGPQGEQGPQGTTGAQGATGVQGTTGPQGPAGDGGSPFQIGSAGQVVLVEHGIENGHMLELTNGSPGGNEDGVSIRLGDYSIDRNNNFITFKDAANDTVGRIEGFDVSNGDWNPPTVTFDSGLGDDLADVACYLQLRGFGRPPTNPVDAAFFVADLALGAACLDGGVVYASGSGDFAEWLPKLDPNEEIGIGDVVGLFGGKISKRTEGASQLMAVSTAPIVLGNEPQPGEEDNYVKVGFIGQIPIEIIGTVNKDDFIIPSGMQNGTAIAVSPEQLLLKDYSKIIGRAWEESSHVGVKLINCVIGVDSKEWSQFVEVNGNLIAEVQSENEELKSEVAQLRDELDQIKGNVSEFASLKASMDLIQASLNKAKVQDSPRRGQQLARAHIQP